MAKKSTIDCPIFKDKEWLIEQLCRDMNGAKDPRDKAERAKELKEQMIPLLECDQKDSTKASCNACQLLANTRNEMAKLIIRVQKLKR